MRRHAFVPIVDDLGDALEHANFGPIPLLLGFITITGAVGVLIVGAIPKWAIFAPIFVPLFMKLEIAPEVVLAALLRRDLGRLDCAVPRLGNARAALRAT